jgi:hypothetical protein
MLRLLYFDSVGQGGAIPILSGRRERFLVYPLNETSWSYANG